MVYTGIVKGKISTKPRSTTAQNLQAIVENNCDFEIETRGPKETMDWLACVQTHPNRVPNAYKTCTKRIPSAHVVQIKQLPNNSNNSPPAALRQPYAAISSSRAREIIFPRHYLCRVEYSKTK